MVYLIVILLHLHFDNSSLLLESLKSYGYRLTEIYFLSLFLDAVSNK